MNTNTTCTFVDQRWNASIIAALTEYIRIPNKSPLFDAEWQTRGHMDRAVSLIEGWCRERPIDGLQLEVIRLPGRTPLLFMEIPGASDDCVLLYGHLDKQPEMSGWDADLGPWKPVLRGDKLYGRGGADDGYAAFASLTAIEALQHQEIPHARCVIIIEACEESGSYDLPYYMDELAERIGIPSLVVCLDSGCGNYDQLWSTTSLRGVVSGNLVVELLREGVHSGDASGIVADGFRIVRQLLSRLEDEATGAIRPRLFHVEIPAQRVHQAAEAAAVLGEEVYRKYPFHEGVRPLTDNLAQLVLNRTWHPALSVTGAAGLPPLENAGNVCRPSTAVKLSLRIPPTCDATRAATHLKTLLEADPPYAAKVRFETDKAASGWEAPPLADWLARSVEQASRDYFGNAAAYMGEGGSIPFMGMLGAQFPEAQFLITGVLGPQSNAHGPNEFLHIPMAKNLTCCVARVLADHYHTRTAKTRQ